MTRNKMPVEKCMKIVEDIINENISIYNAAKNNEVSSVEGLKLFSKRTKYSSELKAIALENVLERIFYRINL